VTYEGHCSMGKKPGAADYKPNPAPLFGGGKKEKDKDSPDLGKDRLDS